MTPQTMVEARCNAMDATDLDLDLALQGMRRSIIKFLMPGVVLHKGAI